MFKYIKSFGKRTDKNFNLLNHSEYECMNCHIHIVLQDNKKEILCKCPVCKQ